MKSLRPAAIALLLIAATLFARQEPLQAAELAAPTGPVVLTVSGAIGVRNSGDTAVFDIAALEALPKTEIRTSTPWTGVSTFEGVSLADLLAAVGATGATIKATALNDYTVEIPAADATLGAIIAYRVDGKQLSVRDKGPLWIVYPFDENPALKTETNFARCIWQLQALKIEP